MRFTKRELAMKELTKEGLDCIDLTLYIDIDKSLEDSMLEIQMAYEYHSLPSDAIAIFDDRDFHNDVFFYMDEDEFDEYLCNRYPDEYIGYVS